MVSIEHHLEDDLKQFDEKDRAHAAKVFRLGLFVRDQIYPRFYLAELGRRGCYYYPGLNSWYYFEFGAPFKKTFSEIFEACSLETKLKFVYNMDLFNDSAKK